MPGSEPRKLDSYDRRILAKLQVQGDLGPAELSEHIHLSMSQCSRRLQRLRAEGYVAKTVALLNEERLHIGVCVYVMVTLTSHAPECTRAFYDRVRTMSEITECHKLTGEADYLLKVSTKDLHTYNVLLNKYLLQAQEIAQVRSSMVLESLKATTQLTLDYI